MDQLNVIINEFSTKALNLATEAYAQFEATEIGAQAITYAQKTYTQFEATEFGAHAIAMNTRVPGTFVDASNFNWFGCHWSALLELWPIIPFAIMFFILRGLFKFYVVPPLARAFGLKGKVVPKFSYQGWLLCFYITSTIYGWVTLDGKPWVSYPLGESQLFAIADKVPSVADNGLALYYSYQMGFFIAELYAIFREPKRSDFYEYLAHHIVTLYLMAFSWTGYLYRIGSYVLIIHDIVDIFLCTSKMVNYLGLHDIIEIPGFALFTASYAFFRMYCLPVLSYHLVTVTRFQHTSWNAQGLAFLLAFGLQSLHVFWFYLIVRIIYRIAMTGEKTDVRSDDEGDDGAEKKKKNKDGKNKKSSSSSSKKAKKE